MLTIQNTEHFRIEKPSIVTIGTFDGVHLGHQKILQRLGELRQQTGQQTVVLTFDPHPRKILSASPEKPALLTTVEEKLELLEEYDVDVTVVYPFSKKFSQLHAEEYVGNILVKSLNTRQLVIGYDHRFGMNREGDINLLRSLAPRFGFTVEMISARDIDNIAISSTKIRKALHEGNIELANEFLGHSFMLGGTVIRGKQLGREIGYPTANLEIEDKEKLIPARGIYFVEVVIEGLLLHGMMSIGTNPTTDNDNTTKLEVHIFDFDANIYDKPLQVRFLHRLREEKKFKDLNELRNALDSDKKKCLELLSSTS